MISKLLTVVEVAHVLGVSKATAYTLVREMDYTRIGRRILVTERALENYIQNNSAYSKKKSKHT